MAFSRDFLLADCLSHQIKTDSHNGASALTDSLSLPNTSIDQSIDPQVSMNPVDDTAMFMKKDSPIDILGCRVTQEELVMVITAKARAVMDVHNRHISAAASEFGTVDWPPVDHTDVMAWLRTLAAMGVNDEGPFQEALAASEMIDTPAKAESASVSTSLSHCLTVSLSHCLAASPSPFCLAYIVSLCPSPP